MLQLYTGREKEERQIAYAVTGIFSAGIHFLLSFFDSLGVGHNNQLCPPGLCPCLGTIVKRVLWLLPRLWCRERTTRHAFILLTLYAVLKTFKIGFGEQLVKEDAVPAAASSAAAAQNLQLQQLEQQQQQQEQHTQQQQQYTSMAAASAPAAL
eukprot:15106-Heterococcus_DN1.PRE.2